jgi:hypothetical protein
MHWPLVVLRLPAHIGEAEVSALAQAQEEIFQRRERYVSLTDTTSVVGLPDARVRSAIGEWLHAIEERAKRYHVANAVVIASPVTRGVLTAVHWLAPPSLPTTVCAKLMEGSRYLEEHARRAGLDVTPFARFRG